MDIYNHFVNCVLQAKYLKSKGFDLSHFRLEQTLKENPHTYTEKILNYWNKILNPLSQGLMANMMTPWDLILMNLIGEYPNLRILDIGCGNGTISKIIAKNNNVTITTIDSNTTPIIKDAYSHTHYRVKWDCKSLETLEKNYYDMIICDVEPHGSEERIYKQFLPFLKDTHIYLGLCIGLMGLGGSYIYENFVETFKTHIIDKFACRPYRNFSDKQHNYKIINDLINTRNTWLIMSKSSVEPINTISDYLFLSGGNYSKYIDEDNRNETFGKNSKRMKLFVDDLSCLEN